MPCSYHVRMDVRLPHEIDPAEFDRLKAEEKARAGPAAQGKWVHLWRVAGQYANMSRLRRGDPRRTARHPVRAAAVPVHGDQRLRRWRGIPQHWRKRAWAFLWSPAPPPSFGAAVARRFARDSHRVIAAGRRAERLERLRQELGPALLPLRLRMSTTCPGVAALPGSLPEGWRAVDVLVNNAGLALGLEPASRASLDDWDNIVAANVRALIHLTRALIPAMVKRNRGPISSISAAWPPGPLPRAATSTAPPRPS